VLKTGSGSSDGAKLLVFIRDAVTKAVDAVEHAEHNQTEEGVSDFLMYPLDVAGIMQCKSQCICNPA
jgi:hypothetical protein